MKNALRAVYPAFISVYLFHLIALYFNVISANINQCSQNTHYEAMKKLGLNNPSKVLKIGDTIVDVQEGKNAKVLTAMVLTGTQSKADLGDLKPDYIFNSIKHLEQAVYRSSLKTN